MFIRSFFCTAKQHKTALSFLVFRVIAAHVNPISTPQHTRYRGPHKRALSMQRSVANPPTDSLALQRETPVAHMLRGLPAFRAATTSGLVSGRVWVCEAPPLASARNSQEDQGTECSCSQLWHSCSCCRRTVRGGTGSPW